MYAGRIVEKAPDRRPLPRHEDAVHRGAAASRSRASRCPATPGSRPSAAARRTSSTCPTGCKFAPRCPYAQDQLPRRGAAAHAGRRPRPRVPLLVPGRHARGHGGAGQERARAQGAGQDNPASSPIPRRPEAWRTPSPWPAPVPRTCATDDAAPARRGPRRRVPGRAAARSSRRLGHQPRRASRARPSASSASRAAASPRRAGRSCSCPARPSGARHASTATTSRRSTARTCAAPAPQLQMIFQDPISSLNPRRKIKDIVGRAASTSGRSAPRPSEQPRSTRSSRPSASTPRRSAIAGPTSSPAASASASRSPGPLVARARSSSSATSRSRPSTCRCRPRS